MIESDYLKENEFLIKNLKKIPSLKLFDKTNLQELLKLSKIRKYSDGEIVIREGSVDSYIYFLIYGQVVIKKDGKRIRQLKRRGDLFGEMGVLGAFPRSASAYSDPEAVCLATNIDYIDRLDEYDKLAFSYMLYRVFAEVLAERLRKMNEALIKGKGKEWKFWQ